MKDISDFSFNDLIEHYLGKRLPMEMADLISMSAQPPEAKAFIIRLLQLMRESGYSATSFTPYLIRWLATVKSVLPCAWGGHIPPLTSPNRHKKIDVYAKKHAKFSENEAPVFLDMGCGFPPITTSETAQYLSNWRVIGVDLSFPDCILYNEDGHYACFSEDGTFQYFQAMPTPSGRALYAEPEQTRKYFKKLFSSLHEADTPTHKGITKIVEKDGCRLIYNHIQSFETDNLSFIQSDICDIEIPPVQVIRCMNVYIYFEPVIRKAMLNQAEKLLADNGIMIIGTNGFGVQSRYFTYQKTTHGLATREFAFSPDNLGDISFMPWFSIHENDPETILLAELTKTIRSDDVLWPEFRSSMDTLLKETGLCRRRKDGFLQIPEQDMQYAEFIEKQASLWQQMENKGYIDDAVKVLNDAGYEAWKNCVGDIAIRP